MRRVDRSAHVEFGWWHGAVGEYGRAQRSENCAISSPVARGILGVKQDAVGACEGMARLAGHESGADPSAAGVTLPLSMPLEL